MRNGLMMVMSSMRMTQEAIVEEELTQKKKIRQQVSDWFLFLKEWNHLLIFEAIQNNGNRKTKTFG